MDLKNIKIAGKIKENALAQEAMHKTLGIMVVYKLVILTRTAQA